MVNIDVELIGIPESAIAIAKRQIIFQETNLRDRDRLTYEKEKALIKDYFDDLGDWIGEGFLSAVAHEELVSIRGALGVPASPIEAKMREVLMLAYEEMLLLTETIPYARVRVNAVYYVHF